MVMYSSYFVCKIVDLLNRTKTTNIQVDCIHLSATMYDCCAPPDTETQLPRVTSADEDPQLQLCDQSPRSTVMTSSPPVIKGLVTSDKAAGSFQVFRKALPVTKTPLD